MNTTCRAVIIKWKVKWIVLINVKADVISTVFFLFNVGRGACSTSTTSVSTYCVRMEG